MTHPKAVLSFLKILLLLTVVGAVLGAFTGLTTLAFIKILEGLQHLIWTSLPSIFGLSSEHAGFTIVICSIGGLLVGLGVKYLGNYPLGISETLEEVKKGKPFDYKHIPQTIVNSLVSLGFGAALGPEAALTSIVGGFCSWITSKLKFLQANANALTMGAVLGSLFGNPLGSAAFAVNPKKGIATKLQIFISSLVAAVTGFEVYKLGSSGTGYFNLATLPYTFNKTDLVYALLPAILGCILGFGFLFLGKHIRKVVPPIKSPVLRAGFGGLVFGLIAVILPLILFSGHEGVQELMTTPYLSAGIGLLLAISIGKIVSANLLLSTGWKGGQFFPVMFAGAAAGLGLTSLFTAIPAMVGLVAGMTAMLAIVLKKPLVAGLFVLFFFPSNLYPTVVIAALLAAVLLRLKQANHQAHNH